MRTALIQFPDERSKYQELPLDAAAAQYFNALPNLYVASAPGTPRGGSHLDSARLFALAGASLQRQKIESKDSLSEEDYRKILRSDYPYTAVVEDEQLQSLISRDRLAVLVARELVSRATT